MKYLLRAVESVILIWISCRLVVFNCVQWFVSLALVSGFKEGGLLFALNRWNKKQYLSWSRRDSIYKLQASSNKIPKEISSLHSSSDSPFSAKAAHWPLVILVKSVPSGDIIIHTEEKIWLWKQGLRLVKSRGLSMKPFGNGIEREWLDIRFIARLKR